MNVVKVLSSWATSGFSRRTQLHGVSDILQTGTSELTALLLLTFTSRPALGPTKSRMHQYSVGRVIFYFTEECMEWKYFRYYGFSMARGVWCHVGLRTWNNNFMNVLIFFWKEQAGWWNKSFNLCEVLRPGTNVWVSPTVFICYREERIIRFSETLVVTCEIIRRYNPEYHNLNLRGYVSRRIVMRFLFGQASPDLLTWNWPSELLALEGTA
jgi:hypothetical protein